jgi:hypothetical protein
MTSVSKRISTSSTFVMGPLLQRTSPSTLMPLGYPDVVEDQTPMLPPARFFVSTSRQSLIHLDTAVED